MAWTVDRLIRSFWAERNRASASRPAMGRRTARYAVQRRLAGVIEIKDTDFVAFAQNPQGLILDVL